MSTQMRGLNIGRMYLGSGKISVGCISGSDKIHVGCISVYRVSGKHDESRAPLCELFFFSQNRKICVFITKIVSV